MSDKTTIIYGITYISGPLSGPNSVVEFRDAYEALGSDVLSKIQDSYPEVTEIKFVEQLHDIYILICLSVPNEDIDEYKVWTKQQEILDGIFFQPLQPPPRIIGIWVRTSVWIVTDGELVDGMEGPRPGMGGGNG